MIFQMLMISLLTAAIRNAVVPYPYVYQHVNAGSVTPRFDDLPGGVQVWLAVQYGYAMGMTDEAAGALVDRLGDTSGWATSLHAMHDIAVLRQWIEFREALSAIPPYGSRAPLANIHIWWSRTDAWDRGYRMHEYDMFVSERRMIKLQTKHAAQHATYARPLDALFHEVR
jgi:hypothetical protein